MTLAQPTARLLDPLAVGTTGQYQDELVQVRRCPAAADPDAVIVTSHFRLHRQGDRLHLTHSLPRHRIDNDLTGLLSAELFQPGWVCGPELFERLLTGIVLSSAPDALAAWELFYRNTLRRLEFLHNQATSHGHGHGSIAGFAPVYQRAGEYAVGSVLEIGCCFGFLSLQLAVRGIEVTASDISLGSVRLLAAVADRLNVQLDTIGCDGARVPRRDASFDTVMLVHLLEHLDQSSGEAVLAEALRLARRRVVVAVPYEDEPDAAFGHVRTLDRALLAQFGEVTGWTAQVCDHHGGWLVLDRL